MLSLRCVPSLGCLLLSNPISHAAHEHSREAFCEYSVSGYTIKQVLWSGHPNFHFDHSSSDMLHWFLPGAVLFCFPCSGCYFSAVDFCVWCEETRLTFLWRTFLCSLRRATAVPGVQELCICLLLDVPSFHPFIFLLLHQHPTIRITKIVWCILTCRGINLTDTFIFLRAVWAASWSFAILYTFRIILGPWKTLLDSGLDLPEYMNQLDHQLCYSATYYPHTWYFSLP